MATTKAAIRQCIMAHLTVTSVTKLTVHDILSLTSVSRTTFYRLFPAGAQELYTLILEDLLTISWAQNHWANALDQLIQRIADQRCLFLNLYVLMDESLWQACFDRTADCFVQHYFGQRYFYKVKTEYLLFFKDAFCWQFHLWFQNDLNGELVELRKKLDTFQLLDQGI